MTEPYSGRWLRNAYVDPRAGRVPTADPAHADTSDQEPDVAVAYDAPPMPEPAPVGEYPGCEWVVSSGGVELDRTNYESHEADTHATELGADDRMNYNGTGPLQFHDERYISERFDGLPPTDVANAALRRGMNSLSENQDGEYNPGRFQVNEFRTERKFAVGERVHDRRIITPNTATEVGNVPASQATAPWAQPYASLARSITNIHQRPELRRPPEPVSDDLLTDGSPAYPALNSWVVG